MLPYMKFYFSLIILFILSLLFFVPSILFSQENLGQYYEEAPLRSWNLWATYPARNAAMGECILALQTKSSIQGMHNPAAMSQVSKITISGGLSLNSLQLFRYSVVNTGVVRTDNNITMNCFSLDYIGISFSLKQANIALNMTDQENYNRPNLHQAFSIPAGGSLDADLNGKLRSFNFSFSYPFFKERLYLGAGFSYLSGSQNQDISLIMRDSNWIAIDLVRDKQILQGYCFHLGFLLKASQKINIGFALRTPYNKKAKSTVYREFSSNYVTISNSYSSDDSYHIPLLVGCGLSYQPITDLLLNADFSFFRWESYQAERFGNILPRDFRNALKIGIGVEYILRQKFTSTPLRIGYIRDPQPSTSPIWDYHYLTFGTGITWRKIELDAAIQLGKGRGGENSFFNRRSIITLNLNL